MENETETITSYTSPEAKIPEPAHPQTPRLREMSLTKARKLIRKTSKLHDGLFRRLAE